MRLEKWSLLAGLRFFLASVVVWGHLAEFVPIGAGAVMDMFGPFEAILGFLLISGYSIGASYIKEPAGFLWRRVKRIYPVYLASLVLCSIVYVVERGSYPSLWELLANLVFANQVVTSTSLVGPAWSLALEFWLYCLTPLLIRTSDRTLKLLIAGSFLVFCVYTCGRTLFHWVYFAGTTFGINLPLLAFIWLAGLLLARSIGQRKNTLYWIAAVLALHVMLDVAIQAASRYSHGRIHDFLEVDLLSFAAKAATLLLVVWAMARVSRSAQGDVRPSAFLRMLGDFSYPLYLVHSPVFFFLKRFGVTSPLIYYATAVLVSAGLYRGLDFYSQRRHAVKPERRSFDREGSATTGLAALRPAVAEPPPRGRMR